MRKKPQFHSVPTASGGIARAAYARAMRAGLEIGPLLRCSSLTVQQATGPQVRMPVRNQIRFLNDVADALPDAFLGIHLAESIDTFVSWVCCTMSRLPQPPSATH
jgi:hypothetical protein